VIDALGDLPIKQITGMFTAVCFLAAVVDKAYHVLSNGEQFRCDLARALRQAGNEAGLWYSMSLQAWWTATLPG